MGASFQSRVSASQRSIRKRAIEPRRAGRRSGSLAGERRQHPLAADPAGILELGRVADDRARERLAAAADHQAGGEGPGLAGEIVDLADRRRPASSKTSRRTAASINSPGSMKPASSEYIPGGQAGGAAEQDRVAVQDQHDDDRVGAREVLGAAGRAGAAPAGVGDRGGGAAAGAEAVGRVPAEDALGRRGGAGVLGRRARPSSRAGRRRRGRAGRPRVRSRLSSRKGRGAPVGGARRQSGIIAGEARARRRRCRGRPAARGRRRRPGRPSAARRAAAGGPGSSSGRPATARGRARAGRRRALRRRRAGGRPRSSAPPAKVTASASRMVPRRSGRLSGATMPQACGGGNRGLEAAGGRRYLGAREVGAGRRSANPVRSGRKQP